MKRYEIIQAIHKERDRQDELHPEWRGNTHGLSILMEEVGEVAKAMYEYNTASPIQSARWNKNLTDELIQVAAVCVRWLENR